MSSAEPLVFSRVETKTPFSFSRKAKISENSLTFREISFRENFHFRESFCEHFRFRESICENFRFSESCRKNFRFRESFREKFVFPGMVFNQFFGSGYTFRCLLNPDPHSK
jgi:hypothetical protein